jgi:hypothetical protein
MAELQQEAMKEARRAEAARDYERRTGIFWEVNPGEQIREDLRARRNRY